jgi:hypothetical protein
MNTTTRRKALLTFFAGISAADARADPMVALPKGDDRAGLLRAGGLRKATLAVEVYYRDPKNLSKEQKDMTIHYAAFMLGFLTGIRASANILVLKLDDKEDDILIPPEDWLSPQNSAPSLGKFLEERKGEIPDEANTLRVLTIWYLRCHPKSTAEEEAVADAFTKELQKKERVD